MIDKKSNNENAKVHVTIGPYTIIGPNVEIGENTDPITCKHNWKY